MNIDIIGADLPDFLDELNRYQGNLLLVNHPELQGIKRFPQVSDTIANAYSQLRHGRRAVQDIALFANKGWRGPADLPRALKFMQAHFPDVAERAQAQDHFAEMGYSSLGDWMQQKLGVNAVFQWNGEQAEHLCGGQMRALSPLPKDEVLHALMRRAIPDNVALVLHSAERNVVLHACLNDPEVFADVASARNRALVLACEVAVA